ncbi:MAG: recombination protein RecR [Bacilli bacterium]|nr:recombination protein RecR [Bacilli bacterium]
MYPDSIKNLIESFKCLQGIGSKTAERLAFSILDLEDEQVEFFASSLTEVKEKIHKCQECNNLTDDDLCFICSDPGRDEHILCVVDDSKSVFLFEKLGIFHGKYHVLDALISPLEGINPEDIGIDKLLKRIEDNHFEEIIFAFKPSIEGETTALYIKRILDGLDIKVSRLASGIPIGADIEYIDSLTLERALNDRKSIE